MLGAYFLCLIIKQLQTLCYFTLLFTCNCKIRLYLCSVNNNKHYKKMRKSHTLLAGLAALLASTTKAEAELGKQTAAFNSLQRGTAYGSPYFTPTKHTVESYRSQQRKAKQRRKAR